MAGTLMQGYAYIMIVGTGTYVQCYKKGLLRYSSYKLRSAILRDFKSADQSSNYDLFPVFHVFI